MARMDRLGAFALTEPDHGSDVVGLGTRARRDGDGWVLDGAKRWIGNGSVADVVVVWARDDDGHVGGFVVETEDADGFDAEVITGKASNRAVWQAEITLRGVRIPADNRLAQARTFADTGRVLTHSRQGVAWEALGHALAAYEAAVAYAGERRQFGRPIAAFQLVQDKLSHMLADITSMQLLCLRLADSTSRAGDARARVAGEAADGGGRAARVRARPRRPRRERHPARVPRGTPPRRRRGDLHVRGHRLRAVAHRRPRDHRALRVRAVRRVGAPISRNRAPCATAGRFGSACTIGAEVRFNGGRMSQHPAEIQEAEAEFAIEERREGIRALVGMSGNLDFTAAPQLGDAIDRLLEARAHELWVDLRDLESIDSTGLAALTSARRRADAEGAKLRLVVERGPVRDVLELGRMDRVFQLATEPPRILR